MDVIAKAEQVHAAACELGEGPVWDTRRQGLWFVDIKRHQVRHFDPVGQSHVSFTAPGQVGWVLPCTDGSLLAGLHDGLHVLDPNKGEFDPLWEVPGEPAGNRLNDACTDAFGAAYFGSMDDGESEPSGRFYRYAKGIITPCGPAGVCITNGPAVSADGRRIYFTDTLAKTIHVADLRADGSVGPARLFADTASHFPGAYPDGPVCDAEGCVWTGLWNGWGVARYDPDGALIGRVVLPVANVTKMAFGGADLRRVFVTTARKGLDHSALAAQPMAGDLFAFDSEVAGCPVGLVELV